MAQPIWVTEKGSIGTYPSGLFLQFQFEATPIDPAISVSYQIISGSIPLGLTFEDTGLLSGIPDRLDSLETYQFVIRATDNLGNLRDRTFNIAISGVSGPRFLTPFGSLGDTLDSIWNEIQIEVDNPLESNEVTIRQIQGVLPPGIEINENGLLRGYPEPPIFQNNLTSIETQVTAISNNVITCISTLGFTTDRPVVFSGLVYGNIEEGREYFIESIIDDVSFTISATVGGGALLLEDGIGLFDATLPRVQVGAPTIRTFSFTLLLESDLGNDTESYSITVINQNAPPNIDGPNRPPNTRVPALLNTRPRTYDIEDDVTNFAYYVIPPDRGGVTYEPSEPAFIGTFESDNFFSFRMLGYDFDSTSTSVEYVFADIPPSLNLTADTTTGWITGYPQIPLDSIQEYNFQVAVKKTNRNIQSVFYNFAFRIANDITADIIWQTPTNIGSISNGTLSTLFVSAESTTPIEYRVVDGALPPNLTLLPSGEISGYVSFEPVDTVTPVGDSNDFTFTVEAFSPDYRVVRSQRTFTLTVNQVYGQPTENLYIKCTPSIDDRRLINSLLDNTDLIPNDALYRPDDQYFGKARDVIYQHAFGIYASRLQQYIEAVTLNHYWRNITLGELKTAVAKNDAGEVIYEVVYSQVVDNLVNPQGESVSEEIVWPFNIPLNLGPWWTSVNSLYTAYEGPDENGQEYYTSLTPGFTRRVYPNSLTNMRNRVGQELGQEFDADLLPLWMTSQQPNGSTLGYTPAWVICYTLPGRSAEIRDNINNDWRDQLGRQIRLNQINFRLDRFTVDKSNTFDYNSLLTPPAWTDLPGATPTPVPLESRDIYVLFPQETILPDETQINR